MLIRDDGERLWMVSQPAHAAVSAQLALVWGNAGFPAPEPRAEVTLGALLHDIGWLAWERHPTLHPATGLPHTFMQLPTTTHLDIWEPTSRQSLPFGRYPALLVSLHGTYLYGFHDYERDTPEEAERARAFVAREEAFQREIIRSLEEDPRTASLADSDTIRRNQRFVALFDGLSLAICGGLREERTFSTVLAVNSPAEIRLAQRAEALILDPWPLNVEELALTVDVRPLDRTFATQDALAEWMESAPVESRGMLLRPA